MAHLNLIPIDHSHLELPVPVPSSLRFYTGLPLCLAEKNHVLFQDVVDLLAMVDRQKNARWRKALGAKVS